MGTEFFFCDQYLFIDHSLFIRRSKAEKLQTIVTVENCLQFPTSNLV